MLHVTGDKEHSGDAVIPFTKQTWKTARCIAQARKQHQKISKYLVVCESLNFKPEPLPHYGFHNDRYSKFTAYQIQSKGKKTCSDDNIVETRFMVNLPIAATLTSGVCARKKVLFL